MICPQHGYACRPWGYELWLAAFFVAYTAQCAADCARLGALAGGSTHAGCMEAVVIRNIAHAVRGAMIGA